LRNAHCVDGEVGSDGHAVIERLATGGSGPAPSLVGDNGSGLRDAPLRAIAVESSVDKSERVEPTGIHIRHDAVGNAV
jgi:hypothetical protein